MNKRIIKLTEQDLHKIVKESVNKILNEIGDTEKGQQALGALQARKVLNADGNTEDEFFNNQSKNGKKVYDYAKQNRSHMGKDSDEWGNTINPLYKQYTKYLNPHQEEYAKRNEKLRKFEH